MTDPIINTINIINPYISKIKNEKGLGSGGEGGGAGQLCSQSTQLHAGVSD